MCSAVEKRIGLAYSRAGGGLAHSRTEEGLATVGLEED